jgi:hypothetical protein
VNDEHPRSTGEEHASLVRPYLHGGPVTEGPEAADLRDAAVRPYLVTSGRTAGTGDLPIEAQVVVTAMGRGARANLTFEYRDIVILCDQPLALAEIAAKLSLHLGVIRVLIGDLRHHGMVTTFEPEGDITDDVETILRVIDGLRQLA